MVCVLCMLDTQDYRHILRICNIACFSMATVATRNRFSVILYVHCLSCWMLNLMVHKVTATPYVFNNVRRMIYIKSSKHISVLHRENFSLLHASPGFLVMSARRAAFTKEHVGFICCIIVEITQKIAGSQFI